MAQSNQAAIVLPQLAVAEGATSPSPGTTNATNALAWSTTLARIIRWTGTAWVTATGGGVLIDQTPGGGAYGTLGGSVNGANKVFTAANGSYATGTLVVLLNGVPQIAGLANDFTETAPSAGTFTFVTAPPTGAVVQALYSAVPATGGTVSPPAPLASVVGLNAKTTGNTDLFTVPAGKTLLVTGVYVVCTAAAGITNGPTVSSGITAGNYNDVYATVNTGTPFTAAGQVFQFVPGGVSVSVPAGTTLRFFLSVSATGTSMTIAVYLTGLLV